MKRGYLIIGILALLLLFSACVTEVTEETTEETEEMEEETADHDEETEESEMMDDEDSDMEDLDTGEEDLPGVEEATTKEFSVIMRQFEFDPAQITVNEGETITLHILSEDVTHGFSLPEFGISESLNGGEQTTVEFVADKKGKFFYSCSVFCGSGHGSMQGTLTVE